MDIISVIIMVEKNTVKIRFKCRYVEQLMRILHGEENLVHVTTKFDENVSSGAWIFEKFYSRISSKLTGTVFLFSVRNEDTNVDKGEFTVVISGGGKDKVEQPSHPFIKSIKGKIEDSTGIRFKAEEDLLEKLVGTIKEGIVEKKGKILKQKKTVVPVQD